MKKLLGTEELTKTRGKWNVYLRYTSNIESKIKELTVSTEICNNNLALLRATKNSFVHKLNKVKELDDKILDL